MMLPVNSHYTAVSDWNALKHEGCGRMQSLTSSDIPKLCSAEHQVLREASPSAPQRDWKEK